MANYLRHGLSTSEKDQAVEMSKPLTPLSERPRASWGSLSMSVQTIDGLCGKKRPGKGGCWRKAGHDGPCP